jgi:hypothetical protein
VRLIYGEGHKNDKLDALRSWRGWPGLTPSCSHRSSTAARAPRHISGAPSLARCAGRCQNQARQPRVRGAVKSFGGRLPKCTVEAFHNKVAEHLPGELTSALEPILETIASLTERIKDYDRKLEDVAEELYPETKLLRQEVHGVGVL